METLTVHEIKVEGDISLGGVGIKREIPLDDIKEITPANYIVVDNEEDKLFFLVLNSTNKGLYFEFDL